LEKLLLTNNSEIALYAATLSIESIPYIKQTVYQSVSPEEELQELFSESTKPLPDNIYPIEPKQPGTYLAAKFAPKDPSKQ
jgi:hypothetical protein